MPDRSAAEIKSALDCHRSGCQCRGNELTHCPGPSHSNGDRNPSLGVTEKAGTVLLKCYATCSQDDVISALQDRDLWPRAERKEPSADKAPTRFPATYDYQNPDGTLNFQVVRKETLTDGEWKKTFLQRRPDGKGGWIWKKGDTNLLYRLPELIASDPAEIVFEVEGEKDADRLTSLGLVATTRAEGAGKWTDANSQWLKGRRVCILGDNDVPGEKDAELRLTSIRKVATAVILELNDLPDHGDVSDWLDAGGTTEYLITLAEAALSTVEPPETPVLTLVESPEVRPIPMVAFPTEVLPPTLGRLVEAATAAMLVPPEFCGVPLLVLAGAAVGNAWEIELKPGWREGPNLYAAIVADPGSKKTPALKLATKPIYAIQRELHVWYEGKKKDFDAALDLWDTSPKSSRGSKPTAPVYPHVVTTDATTEALAGMLASGKGLALHRDELVAWVLSMDQYRSGKGSDRQHYLSMWSRSPIKIDRKSRPDPIVVERPCLSVVGGIQPDVLPDLVGRESRDDGFLDRLLWCYPDLDDDRWTDENVPEEVEHAAGRLFLDLYRLEGAEMPSGDVVPRVARLDAEALAMWREWYDTNAEESRSDDLAPSLRGTWAKLPSQLARIALILHVTQAVDAGQSVRTWVSVRTLAEAADMVEFFKDHAVQALKAVKTSRSKLEDRVIRALTEKGPSTTTQLYGHLGGHIKADRLRLTLETLTEIGKVIALSAPAGPKGGRPGKVWMAANREEEDASEVSSYGETHRRTRKPTR